MKVRGAPAKLADNSPSILKGIFKLPSHQKKSADNIGNYIEKYQYV